MKITRRGRWVVTRRTNGAFVSQHDTIENAIESAANAGGVCDVNPPSYEVETTASVPPPTPSQTSSSRT